jgi:gamma-glutamylcyclotransferase (GGCT)/AIG2-like uncharacterized protein YtfP
MNYSKYTTPQLRKKAGEIFRAWIRKRDEGQPCISCGSYNVHDAGHYYSAGHHPALEFDEDNVHGQCRRCNSFLSGNLIEYRKGLINRIGGDRVEMLDMKAGYYKRHGYKHDRFRLIEIIEKYK